MSVVPPTATAQPRRTGKGKVTPKKRTYNVSTVSRALDIIEAFSNGERELTLSRIVKITKLPMPTVFRMISALDQRGYLHKNPESGGYQLGHRLIELGELAKDPLGFLDKARPIMRRLRDVLNETTYITVRSGDYRIDLEQVESAQDVRRVIKVGHARLLFSGCAGKLLLTALSADELDEYLSRTDLIDDRDGRISRKALEKKIRAFRDQGYAETSHKHGGGAIAAPIWDGTGHMIAALSSSAPYGRYSEELREKMTKNVVEAAKVLSESIRSR